MKDKKPGRPTDSTKDELLKVRVDAKTLETLDKVAKENNQTRSEIVREILPIVSSKEFEDMISLGSLQRMEQYSIKCNEFFSTSQKIELEQVSCKFPAYVVTAMTPPTLFIKYPTYKVRILLPYQPNAVKDIVEPLLKNVEGISIIYETQCAILRKEEHKLERVFLPEVMCLKHTLQENAQLKDEICALFKVEKISVEVWPAYFIMGKSIQITSQNGISYVVTTEQS